MLKITQSIEYLNMNRCVFMYVCVNGTKKNGLKMSEMETKTQLKTEINIKWLHPYFPDIYIYYHCSAFCLRRCSPVMEELQWANVMIPSAKLGPQKVA